MLETLPGRWNPGTWWGREGRAEIGGVAWERGRGGAWEGGFEWYDGALNWEISAILLSWGKNESGVDLRYIWRGAGPDGDCFGIRSITGQRIRTWANLKKNIGRRHYGDSLSSLFIAWMCSRYGYMYKDGYKRISTGMNHKALLDRTAYDVALRLTSSKFYLSALELGSISIHNTVLHTDIDEDESSSKIQSQSPAKTSIAIKSQTQRDSRRIVHSRNGKNFFKQVLGRVLDSCGGQKHGDATAYLCSRLEWRLTYVLLYSTLKRHKGTLHSVKLTGWPSH